MKTLVLRTFCLVALAGASWAVWGADGNKKQQLPSPAGVKPVVVKPTASLKVVAAAPATESLTAAAPVATTPPPAPVVIQPPLPPAAASVAASTDTTLKADTGVHLSLSTLTPTPEMWFYEQMRQDYDNPALQSRLRGERAAAERRARLAARAWYGVSNGRPMAHTTPFTYYYSPMWSSNTSNPFLWTARPTTQIHIDARRPVANVSGFGVW